MERTRELINPQSLTIRFHHLAIFNDLTSAFTQKFGGVKPWDMDANQKTSVGLFVSKFVDRDFEGWLAAKNYLENLAVVDDDKEAVRRLRYIHDLNGDGEVDKFFATSSRKRVFNTFFEISFENKNKPISLTLNKDSYCGTCVVGKHCDRRLLQKIFRYDRDYVFEKALQSFRKRNIYSEDLKSDSVGKLYITPNLLFENTFYLSLWKEIKEGGDGDWI